MARGRHANFATGAFGGAPMRPRSSREVPEWGVANWGGAEIGDDDDDDDGDDDCDDEDEDGDADDDGDVWMMVMVM
eukprot:9474698-Pyramimonas_sp.AAC.1